MAKRVDTTVTTTKQQGFSITKFFGNIYAELKKVVWLSRREVLYLTGVVLAVAAISGLAVLAMMGITVMDVLLRDSKYPIVGAYDIVKIAGTVTIAAALPYTTAVKGHVAIEFFYHKLSRTGRIILDVFLRGLSMILFSLAAWQCVLYGNALKAANQVSQTLQWPIFWLPYLIAVCFVVMVLVILQNMLHPGKEMIKP